MLLAQHLQNILYFFLEHICPTGVLLPVSFADLCAVGCLVLGEVSVDEVKLLLSKLAALTFIVRLQALRRMVVSQIDEVEYPLVAASRRVRPKVQLVVAMQLLDRDPYATLALTKVVIALAEFYLFQRSAPTTVALTNEAFADPVIQVRLLASLSQTHSREAVKNLQRLVEFGKSKCAVPPQKLPEERNNFLRLRQVDRGVRECLIPCNTQRSAAVFF